jgi:flagellar basal-body rod protein FlgF
MNYGTFLSTSGVLASMRRMDVIANNLANANTIGFKPDLLLASERPAERIEGLSPFGDPLAPPQAMLEKLGGGLRFERDRIDFSQGSLERTNLPTDLALRGEGFFVVAPANGKKPDPKAPTELTRAGNLSIDADGTFRLIGSGRALIGESGEPVKIDPTKTFAVDTSGRVFQNDTEVARFRVVKAKNPAAMEKAGANLFRTTAGVTRVDDGSTEVEQRMLEQSAADPINSMVELMRQSRMLEANVRMMQYQDSMTGQAIAGITRNA